MFVVYVCEPTYQHVFGCMWGGEMGERVETCHVLLSLFQIVSPRCDSFVVNAVKSAHISQTTEINKNGPRSTVTNPVCRHTKKKPEGASIMVLTVEIHPPNDHAVYHKNGLVAAGVGQGCTSDTKLESKSLKLVVPDCCCSEQEKKKTMNKNVKTISLCCCC